MTKADLSVIIQAILPKTASHMTVRLSDGTEIQSTLNTLADLRVCEGLEVSDEFLDDLRSLSERDLCFERASEMALRHLISCKELKTKLLRKGIAEENADYCIQKLLHYGILNDANYAEAVVRHYAGKGYGAGRIRTELAHRGIPRDLWEEAMETMPESDDTIDRYISSHLSDPDDPKLVKKVSDALFRRGYSWDEIRAALRRAQT